MQQVTRWSECMQVTTCPDCNGTGSRGEPCGSCGGDGRVRRSKKISLRVPPGVDNGSRLRVKGEGNAGLRGGQGGDLYVFISVKKHSSLRREGVTIHSDVDVTYIDAILGRLSGHLLAQGFLQGSPSSLLQSFLTNAISIATRGVKM